jgi:DNA polymerase (family X)
MENIEIAAILDDVAALLEIQGANPFRIRAYQNAARTVEAHTVAMHKMLEDGEDLTELPSVGKQVAKHIEELVETGKLSVIEEIAKEIPLSLIELTRLPGVGAKKARALWESLDVKTIDDLERVAKAGQVAGLKGFGKKTEEKILKAITSYRKRQQGRVLISEAERLLEPMVAYLREHPGVERLDIAGSYRRRLETIGDIDLLAIASNADPVMDHFIAYPEARTVQHSGCTRGTLVLKSGLKVDLRILPAESYGAGLQYFTGSKEHNVRFRKLAVSRNLRVSEYGVFAVEGDEEPGDIHAGKRVAGDTEESVYAALALPWIPPELREDRGEIAAAEAGTLPSLIGLDDLKGDLQMHSTWSDGKNSIEEMLEACVAKGYEYFALTDHSKALAMTGGLDAHRIREQWEEIAEVQERHPEIRLLRSQEIDILADGSLDQDDDVIAEFDLVVISVHSRFDLPAIEQTDRIIRALEHPHVHVLAHPTGRLINRRDPMEFDVDAVLHAAVECNVAVELNAHPNRLDLRDTHLMHAKELGAKVVISTDAHRTDELDLMRYGVDQARRAWLEPGDVLNCLSLDEFLKVTGAAR